MRHTADIDNIKVSSRPAPTAEDIAEPQHAALIHREIRKGIDSGVSDNTIGDIWAEALRRAIDDKPN
jgi:hypothetical protein